MRCIFPAVLACSFLLAACSGSEPETVGDPASNPDSTNSSAASGQFPAEGALAERIDYYVTRLRPQLPMPVNNSTVMNSVNRQGFVIELHYTVIDPAITRQQLVNWLVDAAPANTCNNEMTAQMVRDGASFRYTYSGGTLSRPVSRTVTQC